MILRVEVCDYRQGVIDVVQLAVEQFMRNISALTEDQIRASSLLPG